MFCGINSIFHIKKRSHYFSFPSFTTPDLMTQRRGSQLQEENVLCHLNIIIFPPEIYTHTQILADFSTLINSLLMNYNLLGDRYQRQA